MILTIEPATSITKLDDSLVPNLLDRSVGMDVAMTDAGTRQGNVQVHFATNSPDIELPEGKRQLLVPTSKDRFAIPHCPRTLTKQN